MGRVERAQRKFITILVNKLRNVARYEVSTAVATKSTTYLDVTLCTPVEMHRLFGGTYYLILKKEAVQQRLWTYTGLQAVISLKIPVLLSKVINIRIP